jgi:DNA-binding transcriptional LysR family regulator
MNDLDPAWLRSFDAIARTGSVTRAAQQVHRTQSAVSTQLQQLEASVGARLVERSTRSLALTEHGERFLPHARGLLAAQQAALASVTTRAAPTVWRIGVSEYFLPAHLGELLAVLRDSAPGVRFELMWSASAALQRLWDAGEIDLAIVTTAASHPDARLLRREPLAWVAAPGQLPAPGASIPLVLLGPDCPVHAMALRAMARSGLPHHLQLSCSGSQAAVAAVRAGWGVGCLNLAAVPPDLQQLTRAGGRQWPPAGRLAFHLLARPALRAAERALRRWASAA